MALPDLPLAAFITLTTWALFESLDRTLAGDRRGHAALAAARAPPRAPSAC